MGAELIITEEFIMSKILLIRGQKVMIDRDLAELYDVTTGNLNKSVKRNLFRFPDDFMFQLTKEEFEILIFQNGTSSWGGTRKLPSVFTEQGVAMLSSILNSEQAIKVNIHIIRVFAKMLDFFINNLNLTLEVELIKKKLINHDKNIELVFSYLDEMIEKQENKVERNKIGYKK